MVDPAVGAAAPPDPNAPVQWPSISNDFDGPGTNTTGVLPIEAVDLSAWFSSKSIPFEKSLLQHVGHTKYDLSCTPAHNIKMFLDKAISPHAREITKHMSFTDYALSKSGDIEINSYSKLVSTHAAYVNSMVNDLVKAVSATVVPDKVALQKFFELAPITIYKSDGTVLWTASEAGAGSNKIARSDGTLRFVNTVYQKFVTMLKDHGPDSADPQFWWGNSQQIRVNYPTEGHPTGKLLIRGGMWCFLYARLISNKTVPSGTALFPLHNKPPRIFQKEIVFKNPNGTPVLDSNGKEKSSANPMYNPARNMPYDVFQSLDTALFAAWMSYCDLSDAGGPQTALPGYPILLKIQNDGLIGAKFSAAVRVIKTTLGKPKTVIRQQGRIIFNTLVYDPEVWLDEFLAAYSSYQSCMSKLGETVTDSFLLGRLRDPFITFTQAVDASDNYGRELYRLADSGSKLMEAGEQGLVAHDIPHEHRQAWKSWLDMCQFADRLRAKYNSTVVRKMGDPMWDIRLLDNKLQSNAPVFTFPHTPLSEIPIYCTTYNVQFKFLCQNSRMASVSLSMRLPRNWKIAISGMQLRGSPSYLMLQLIVQKVLFQVLKPSA